MSKSVEKSTEKSSAFYEDYAKKGNFYLGSLVYKDSRSPVNQRYLWLEGNSGELRWSNHSIMLSQFKRIALTHINKLFKIQQAETFGFQLETHHHTIRFWANSQDDRDNWVLALNIAIDKKENKHRLSNSSSVTPKNADENKRTMISDKFGGTKVQNLSSFIRIDNDVKSKDEHTTVLSKLMTLVSVFNTHNQASPASFEDLPSLLQAYITQSQNSLLSLRSKLASPSDESIGLSTQVAMLQEKVTSLEVLKQKYDTQMYSLQDLTNSYHNEKQLTEDIAQILERLQNEKNKSSRDCKLFKTELDFVNDRNVQLEKRLEGLNINQKITEIYKGVEGIVSKRGKEVYVRLISVSSEKDRIVLRPTDSFATERDELLFSEITSMTPVKKTENNSQITVHNLDSPLSISVSNDKSGVLIDLTALFNTYKKLQTEKIEKLIEKQFKSNCEVLENQLRFEEKRMKLYKSVVINSIFDVDNSKLASQSMYEAEVTILSEALNQTFKDSISDRCMDYLKTERREIISNLLSLNSRIAEHGHLECHMVI